MEAISKRKEQVDQFKELGKTIVWFVQNWVPQDAGLDTWDWRRHMTTNPEHWKIDFDSYDEIKFSHIHHPNINFGFYNIAPKNVLDITVEPPIKKNESTEAATVDTIQNDSDAELTLSYAYTKEEKTHSSQDAGVALELSFQQEIWYGTGEGTGVGAGGKTSFGGKISAHYKKQWGEEETKTKEQTLEVKVPPYTKCDLTQIISKADFTQRTNMRAEVGFGVHFGEHGKWGIKFDKAEDMIEFFAGFGFTSDAKQWGDLKSHFKKHPAPADALKKLKDAMKGVIISTSVDLDISKASSGNINVKSFEI